MTLETVDANGRIIVARTAKMLRIGNRDWYGIRAVDHVTAYTLFQAVLFLAYALEHGLIALVLEHAHVIASHVIRVFHATVALAHRN